MSLPWNFGTGTTLNVNFFQQLQEDLEALGANAQAINITSPPYSAVPDGPDNSVAIQQALDDGDEQGLPVFIPGGTFYAKELIWPNVGIFGVGKDKSILKLPDGSDTYILASATWFNDSAFTGVAPFLRDLTFDGNKDNQTIPSSLVIASNYKCSYICINVQQSKGIGFIGTSQTRNSSDGNGNNFNQSFLLNCDFRDNDSYGFYAENDASNGLADNVYVGCNFFNNLDWNALSERASGDCWLLGDFFGDAAGPDGNLWLQNCGGGIRVQSCVFNGTDYADDTSVQIDGFQAGSQALGLIAGNTFEDFSSTGPRTHLAFGGAGSNGSMSVIIDGNSFLFSTLTGADAISVDTDGSYAAGALTLGANSYFPVASFPQDPAFQGEFVGSGAPGFEAAKGSIYRNTAGSSVTTRLYVNTDSSTGWTSIITAT